MKPGVERRNLSQDEFYRAVHGDVDPMNFAGEGFSAPDEIAREGDVDNPWLRGRIDSAGEDYWPGPKGRK